MDWLQKHERLENLTRSHKHEIRKVNDNLYDVFGILNYKIAIRYLEKETSGKVIDSERLESRKEGYYYRFLVK